MSKIWYALFGVFIGAVSFISLSAHAQVSTNYWKFSSNYILPNVASWGLQIPSLSNLACIGTDSTGKFQSGTCGGGGGTISTSSPLVAGQGVYATGVNTIASVATSTPSLGLGLSYSGTLGNFYSGTSGTLSIASSSLFTGTTGQNAYFNGTNSIIGTSTLFTSTASHIGIGTTSPASELSIQSVVTSGAQSEDLLTLANTASGGLWNFRIGNGTGFAAGYFNICQGQCTGTNYELQFQGFGVAQARGAFSAPAFDSSITGRGSSPILQWTNTGGSFNGTLDVGENYVSGNINLNNWIGGTGSWNIKRSDGSSLALATLLNSNNNLGIGTSTPGTFFSAGSSTNYFNLDVYGTSTLSHGLRITSSGLNIASLATAAGSFLAVDGSGNVIATTTPSGGSGVTSVTGTYPVISSGGTTPAISLAFGTTTSNIWAGTQTFTNSPVFSILGAGAVNSTSGGTIYNTATTSVSSGTGISFTGTAGALIGGSNLTITNSSPLSNLSTSFPLSFNGSNVLSWIGLATTSQPVSSNILVSNGTNGIYGAATTTASCSGTVSCTTFNTLGSSPITITGSGYSPSGTTGQFPYFSNTNTLTATSNIFLSATGLIGVGSTTPWAMFGIATTTTGGPTTTATTTVTTVGSYTYSLPIGVMPAQVQSITVHMWGGGGGGGQTNLNGGAGGGGAGAYVRQTITTDIQLSYTGTVGQGAQNSTGGTGYQPGGNGASGGAGGGGSTSFIGGGNTFIACGGGGGSDANGTGAGGTAASGTTGGTGGTNGSGNGGGGGGCGTAGSAGSGGTGGAGGTGGTTATGTGGNGAAGVSSSRGGGGGSSAGQSGNGNNGNAGAGGNGSGGAAGGAVGSATPPTAGSGADSGGGGGAGNSTVAAGTNGAQPGAGGGGSFTSGGAGTKGGDGKVVIVIVYSSVPSAPIFDIGINNRSAFEVTNAGNVNIGSSSPGLSSALTIDSNFSFAEVIMQAISGVKYYVQVIDQFGHLITSGPTPTVSSCGTSPSIVGNDRNGHISTSGTVTTCTVTFAKTYTNAPQCTIGGGTLSTVAVTTSTTGFVATFGTSQAGTGINYICQSYQ